MRHLTGTWKGVVIAILLFTRTLIETPPGVDEDGLVELVIRPSGPLRAQAGTGIIDSWSYPDYLDVRDGTAGLAVTGWSRGEALVRLPGQRAAIPVSAMYVSSNYFATIGVSLSRGPGFTPVDDAARAEPEAVIGHRVWQVRFGSDPDIIGRAIAINQTDYVIVGVAQEGFRGHVSGLGRQLLSTVATALASSPSPSRSTPSRALAGLARRRPGAHGSVAMRAGSG